MSEPLARLSGSGCRTRVVAIVTTALVVGVSAVMAAVLLTRPSAAEPTGMFTVAPGGVIERSDVPEAISVMYLGAEIHTDVFAATPCFCGCDDMLGHRHLLDCFVRPDGAGWEAHAAGCGVCLGEAAQILDLVEQGWNGDAIVDAVIDQWSDPYLTEG